MNGQPLLTCSFTSLTHSLSLPLQLLPQHEGVMHLGPSTAWKGASNKPPRKDGSAKRIQVLKGWCSRGPKVQKAAGREQKAGPAGALLYHQRDPISTSSVYKLKQKTVAEHRQQREREGGSGRRHFFRGSGTFMAMLIKCFWERVPPTLLAAHTPKTA